MYQPIFIKFTINDYLKGKGTALKWTSAQLDKKKQKQERVPSPPPPPLVRPRVRNIPELVGCIEVVVEEVVADADGLRTVITVGKGIAQG